jgi:hypothetical protein
VTNLGHNDLIIRNKWIKEHGAVPVPTTQEVWFIRGHCRHPGAAEIIPWPKEPLQDSESLDSDNDTLVTSGEAELPSEIEYIDDIIQFLKQKKKRIRKHKRRLTPNQKLQKQESERIQNANTPFQRSTRCALPDVVDEEEAEQYYES